MYSKECIGRLIKESIKDVTGITILDKDTSLIGSNMSILPAKFLYIFELLEKKLQLPVHDIYKEYTFEVMTIENLTDALFDLDKRINPADISL
jgi:hypothetical protein